MFNQNCPDLKQLVKDEDKKGFYVKGKQTQLFMFKQSHGYSWKSLMMFLFKWKNNKKKQVKEIFNKPEGTQNIKINKCVFLFPPNGPILDQSEKE